MNPGAAGTGQDGTGRSDSAQLRCSDGGGAGVVVVMLPREQRSVATRAGFDLNDPGRAEIGPRELFAAGPDNLDGLAGRFGQTRASRAASPVCFPP